jgi:hypothetical protein
LYGLIGLEDIVKSKISDINGEVVVTIYTGRFNCARGRCECGSEMNAGDKLPVDRAPPLGSPAVITKVSVEAAGDEIQGLAAARSNVIACFTKLYPVPGDPAYDDLYEARDSLPVKLERELAIVAQSPHVVHSEIDMRVGNYPMQPSQIPPVIHCP